MKIEDDDDENEKRRQEEDSSKLNNDSSNQEQSNDMNRSNTYESCLADDEASPPSIHKLMRIRALNDRKEKKEDHQQQQQSKLRSLRSLRRAPLTSSKKKPTFTNQPTMYSITPNEKLLPNSPNSPIPYNGEAYTYNVPMTPFAPPLYPNQFNLTSDPAMYQTTNVAPQNNWWNASAWKSSLISSFKGVSKLFQPGNTVTDSGPTLTSNNINATVGDLNLQSAVVISSGNAVVVPQSTPPRNGTAVAKTAPSPVTTGKVKPVDDLEFDSAIILSDSDFSRDAICIMVNSVLEIVN
jgi:hypothetical protein